MLHTNNTNMYESVWTYILNKKLSTIKKILYQTSGKTDCSPLITKIFNKSMFHTYHSPSDPKLFL